jgi:leucyl-tRNA synthetase
VIHESTQLLAALRFNVVVARVMELVNATRKAIDSGCGPADPAVREAAETVAIVLSLVAPYTAEEMWCRLGHEPSVAHAGWPTAVEELLVEDSVTCVVQVQGRVRAKLDVPPGISETELQALAMAESNVRRAIGDGAVRKVIVRAPKVVNIVVG